MCPTGNIPFQQQKTPPESLTMHTSAKNQLTRHRFQIQRRTTKKGQLELVKSLFFDCQRCEFLATKQNICDVFSFSHQKIGLGNTGLMG